ncbi:MAG: SDR family NAD(P)-dependent oxidoreductase [Sphingopyxis sp.]|jgi:NAD(P)-dependent dehydrogenase (short-subunit alcohol dehydrogenase family)|uniref:SDR family NAD(P)-dependent oxidoreductase n=1 Tax=unclassified Sphingopyxis TaxID=2614943 RepID=UPI00073137DD|nr:MULTISPECIES: SDR family oxidoreductase [unclassified Sphingopyxis]KTE00350.1 3-oxoacyl-ACP reductase [Sphingopyxis sp. H012]KTE06657.1 3-oxoacyl-ACP reductase [Sphingopyxis sp. H053]KTE08844.1 3-oxoacyl-ACP reductase [Sphingopyxis sp. H093]KTE28786.1 3-oxoacyl-ACP reductase [Sphingopyxis sp. H080]KTE32703.1 3-oxoacyl-ACP reductase [Sphingopyxis sp. H038]
MSTHILITGASRGIGAAIADAFATGATKVVALSSADGDLSDPATPDRLWQASLDRLDGRIDVLVNNAGVFEANPLGDPNADWLANWNRTMQVNLTASAQLCRHAVLHWHERGAPGRIVNIASRAAYRGDSPAHWHYAASKSGMVAMTKTIARAYAKDGILAFAICPGFTMTGMAEDYLASRGGEKLLADIPLGRVAMPDEVGEMARWCALDAPASMTGAVLDVNGASYVR